MSTPVHHPHDASSQPGISSLEPSAALLSAGGKFKVVTTSSEHGRIEVEFDDEAQAVEDFESAQRCACFGPASQFGDVIQIVLLRPCGSVLRQSPRWS